jgi:hypothetical protein
VQKVGRLHEGQQTKEDEFPPGRKEIVGVCLIAAADMEPTNKGTKECCKDEQKFRRIIDEISCRIHGLCHYVINGGS